MLIGDLLKPDQIRLDLRSADGPEAIREVASLLRPNPAITDFEGFCAELLARERVESTCLGNGVAFPHARTDHIKGMVLSIGRSAEGIPFANGQAVRLLYIIGTTKRLATDYLSVVGGLVRILKDAKLRDALIAAPDPTAFIDIQAAAERKF